MRLVRVLLVAAGVLLLPGFACAAGGHAPLDLPVLSVLPFVLLLLCIAVLPLIAEHWWHKNRNKAIVCALCAVPVALYLGWVQYSSGQPALAALGHEMFKYVSFIVLLGSLFIVAGGIVLKGDLRATPLVNTIFLALGSVLASFIGTTGASMLLIRPMLRTNKERERVAHIPVFFIFTVSNLGGLLTPLGDPPLFLGFLKGVPFLWTFNLWREWLLVVGAVLVVFYIWDSIAYARESRKALASDDRQVEPLAIQGTFNFVLLAGVILGVALEGWIPGEIGDLIGGLVMATMAVLSLWLTPRSYRQANEFNWDPIIEVAVLFAGIFAAMVPALELLKAHGHQFGLTQPWQYFWLTGLLSSFLDNAPTYLAFATLAAGSDDLSILVEKSPDILAAISCGAVFMGANTYIGNGPNFMVKAIADSAGYKTPSFLGYAGYACLILLPIFVVVTFLFFPVR
jgi:Na+/H+ antiporter NhaD/arsenite permease-like protein